MLSLTQLDQSLRSKKFSSVYLIQGSELFLRKTAIQRICSSLSDVKQEVIEPIRINCSERKVGDLLESAQNVGLFVTHQILIAGEIQAWPADDLTAVAAYAENPNQSTTLILFTDKLDGRTKAAKSLLKLATVIVCKPLYPNQIPDWIRMECSIRGKAIGHETARLVADAVGVDLSLLDHALEKLILWSEDAKIITDEMVEQVIVETSIKDIFSVTRAVATRANKNAINGVERLLEAGEPGLRILAMLARHWRILLKANEWKQFCRGSERDLAVFLGVHPFHVKEYVDQAKNFSTNELVEGLSKISTADREFKRTTHSAKAVLTNVLFSLMERKSYHQKRQVLDDARA